MKKQISPKVAIAVIVAVVILIVLIVVFAVAKKPGPNPMGGPQERANIGSPMEMMKKIGGAGFGSKAPAKSGAQNP
jgi:cell division protein FtsN